MFCRLAVVVILAMSIACNEPLLHNAPQRSFSTCGDGIVQVGEECDDGVENSDTAANACRTTCVPASCGDGVVDAGEECDSGTFPSPTCFDGCVAWMWTRAHDGDASEDDVAYAVAVDAHDNVVVAGFSTFADERKEQIWVTKYDPTGTEQWTQTFGSEHLQKDAAWSVATDGDDIIVAGVTRWVTELGQVWVHRLDANGDPVWPEPFLYNSTYDGDDGANAVAVDPNGFILVTGRERTAIDEQRIWVSKLSPDGAAIWSRSVPGGWHEGTGVATDTDGNVVVTATLSHGEAMWLRKYDADGTVLWTQTYDGGPGGSIRLDDVAIDSADNILVTGSSVYFSSPNLWIRKVDAAGTPIWTRVLDSPENGIEVGTGITVDLDDNVVVTAREDVPGADARIWLGKLDPEGGLLWTRRVECIGPCSSHAVATDSSGHVVVAGYTTDNLADIWVRKYLP
jgi:hypothetical protein